MLFSSWPYIGGYSFWNYRQKLERVDIRWVQDGPLEAQSYLLAIWLSPTTADQDSDYGLGVQVESRSEL